MRKTYAKAARLIGHEVRITHMHELEFDMDFGVNSYKDAKPLEPDLEKLLEDLKWCEHLVLTTPMWWGGLPAKLKGAIDRAFMPGITFDNNTGKGKLPKPMLSGRSARVILTSDTPGWFMRLIYKNAIIHQLKKTNSWICWPDTFQIFPTSQQPVIPKEKDISNWLDTVQKLGTNAI